MQVDFPDSFSGLTDLACVLPAGSGNFIFNWRQSPSSSSYYRVYYQLVDGKLFPYNSVYYSNQRPQCEPSMVVNEGDLVYKPELKVYFPLLSFCIICFLLIMIYRIFIKRLLP